MISINFAEIKIVTYILAVFDHHEIKKSNNMRINYGKQIPIKNPPRKIEIMQNRNNRRFESGNLFFGIQRTKKSFSSLLS